MALLKDLTVFGASRFVSDAFGSNIYANKHIKNGSTDSYVLLGAGGHKLESSLAVLSATKLATARTLKIGLGEKTFDGSANVTWTLANVFGTTAIGSTSEPIYWDGTSFVKCGNVLAVNVNSGTANRIAWYNETNKISSASNIWTNGTKLGVNITSEPSYNFYVSGSSMFTNTINIDSNTMGAQAHINFNRANYNYINIPTGGTLAVSINGAGSANSFLSVDATSVYPGYHNNSISLGTSTYRWSKLYVGTADSYGNATTPIYWNAGVPKACSYGLYSTVKSGAKNLMAWYSGANEISAATTIYASDTALSINSTTAPANSGNFQVKGISTMRHIYTEANNTYSLGSTSYKWKYLYSNIVNSAITDGTRETTGGDHGSSANPRYFPDVWKFNSSITPSNGDIITIKIPGPGHDYGVFLSMDNGSNYYPITLSGTGRMTTHFPTGSYITLLFDSSNSAGSMFARAGQNNTSRITVSGGTWRVINYYDSGNPGDWNLRQYNIKAAAQINNTHIIGGTDSGYKNIDAPNTFDIRYPILWAGSDIGSGSAGSNNYIHHYSVNVRNNSNSNISTFTSYKNVYIKGTISGNTFTPISGGNPYVQDITASDDGYVYYYIGRAYASNAITFDGTGKDIYVYKNGTIQRWSGNAEYSKLLTPISENVRTSISNWNIPSGSTQVWGQCWSYKSGTKTYTPSGGSATNLTDTGDLTMWLTPSATSNAATLNMRIDGTYYGSFSGNLSGNATTANQFASNATVSLTGDTTGTSAGSVKSWTVPTITKYITCLGRRSTVAAINLNSSVDTNLRMTWHISDSTSRINDATNSPSFDAAIINLPWDWGGYNGQIAISNTIKDNTRMQIRSSSSVDNGEGNTPRYSPNYGAWREVVTAPKATQVGSSTIPIYISNTGQVTACSYSLSSTINAGKANRLAYYSGANTITYHDSLIISTAITYGGRSITPLLRANGILYADSQIESGNYFLVNKGSAGASFYLYTNAIEYGRLFTDTVGVASTTTTYTNPDDSSQTKTGYINGVLGKSILTLGNNKVFGYNGSSYSSPGSASTANNAAGYLRLYSTGSGYGELTGYGSWIHANSGLSIRENAIGIMFRPINSAYYTHFDYETSGNEALVMATQNTVTSFIFVNGESYANVASDRWTKLTGASGAGPAPGLQIKQNCVRIGGLWPSGTNAETKLRVDGTVTIYPNQNTKSSTTWTYPGGGYYATEYPNIRLIGDNDHGISTIEFISQKKDTAINKSTDCAFIQFNPYGITTQSAIGTQPTLATSEEVNRLIIGVNNDSNDQLWLQTPAVDGLRHIVGTANYRILTSQNTYVSSNKGYINGTEITLVNNATSATNATKLSNTSSSDPNTCADGQNVRWYSQIGSTVGGSSGYAGQNYGFPVGNNANGILWLGTHSGPYGHQIGVSSNGELYDRYISNNTFPTDANGASWKLILNSSNSSVSGGGSSWGSSITVKIGGTSKTLTIPSNPNTHNSHIIYSGKKADGTTDIASASSSGNITLGASGVTANAYGDSGNQTPGYGSTFKVPYIRVNAQGIVTEISEHTVKIPATDNTHFTTHLYIGAASANSNAATTNGNTYIKLYDDSTLRNQYYIKGSGATTVTSDNSGNITITSANDKVTQNKETGNQDLRLLFKYTNNDTNETNTVKYATTLLYNPSTKLLTNSGGDIRLGNNEYFGTASGSQCHMQYDNTNRCLKIMFD